MAPVSFATQTDWPASRPVRLPGARRASAGFLLNELLISLGIFAIGMAALASLFPVAALLQRETTEEVFSQAAAQSAKAIIASKEGSFDLSAYHTNTGTTGQVFPILQTGATQERLLPQTDRAFPSTQVNGTDTSDCDFFWVPFVQDLNGDQANPNWVVRIFILTNDSEATYNSITGAANPDHDPAHFPRVVSRDCNAAGKIFTTSGAHGLEPGDVFMDSNGNDYVVGDVPSASTIEVLYTIPTNPAAPDKIWYAPRLGGSFSPAQSVVTTKISTP